MIQTDIWVPLDQWAFLPPEPAEYPLLALLTLLALMLLVRSRQDFAALTRGRVTLLPLLLAAGFMASHLFVLTFPASGLLPIPGIPAEPAAPSVSLIGALPLGLAGAWLGAGPALLVGLATGLARALAGPCSVLDPFAAALQGYLTGVFLRQGFRGLLPTLARQPVLGQPLASLLAMPLVWIAALAHTAVFDLDGMDYASSLVRANALPLVLQSLAAGVLLQIVYLAVPLARPAPVGEQHPAYRHSLTRRVLLLLAVLWLLVVGVSSAVTVEVTIGMAEQRAAAAMGSDAQAAAQALSVFVQTGQGLLSLCAEGTTLRTSEDTRELEAELGAALGRVPFFSQLALYDASAEPVAAYPRLSPGQEAECTPAERATLVSRVLETGAPQSPAVCRTARGGVQVAFMVPVERSGGRGVLVGFVAPDVNPLVRHALALMVRDAEGREAFVTDPDGRIVLHRDTEMLLSEWRVDEQAALLAPPSGGSATVTLDPLHGHRALVFQRRMDDYPWTVVIEMPYRVILDEALHVALPLVLTTLGLGALGLLITGASVRRMVRPLGEYAAAAERFAQGDLTRAVRVSGHDEVARVGASLETLRLRLRQRLEGVGLLLQVSQALSGTLDPSGVLESVAETALRSTQAHIARVLALDESGAVEEAVTRGLLVDGMDLLDDRLVRSASDHRQPFWLDVADVLDGTSGPPGGAGRVRSVLAAPVRAEGRTLAVIWLGYGALPSPDSPDVALVSTLADQASVLLENARCYAAAEDARRRFSAVLHSAPQPLVALDAENRLVLVNPAAERLLGLAGEQAVGRPLSALGLDEALVGALALSAKDDEVLTREVTLADGRTWLVQMAAICGPEGGLRQGQIASIQDVTRQKRLLDEQSSLMETVLHDLRAPLTFVRGYAALLPMVGEFNDKQQGYLAKIQHGVDMMASLLSGLLDLSRIESGEGLEWKPCHLGAILVEVVDRFRAQAVEKGLTLRLEPAERMAIVTGDPTLLSQAIANLLDNAIKFTPAGGIVTVGMSVKDGCALVRVADTGIGVAPEDQQRIFGKFGRIRRRETMHVPGVGLGLATVQSIAERHKGKVWVESEPGKGSIFVLSLPLGDQVALDSIG